MAPENVMSALEAVSESLGKIVGTEAIAMEVIRNGTVYVSKGLFSIGNEALSNKLGLGKGRSYRWIRLDRRDDQTTSGELTKHSTLGIPIMDGNERVGNLTMFNASDNGFAALDNNAVDELSEVLSLVIVPFLDSLRLRSNVENEDLKGDLLDAVGDEFVMKDVLSRMMEQSGAEFCGYCTGEDGGWLYLMLEGRELSPRIADIREKLFTAYEMFTNRRNDGIIINERTFYKDEDRNLVFLLRDSKVESYFLVPLISSSKVRGVIYFGSVRKDAFTKKHITTFRKLADENDDDTPLVFRVGGETGIMEKVLDAIPFAGALVSKDGKIVCSNAVFSDVFSAGIDPPESISQISSSSPYNIVGPWEEFRVLKRDIIDRELEGSKDPAALLTVSMVRIEELSEDVDSLIIAKDISDVRRSEAARNEAMATVAHEIRTPITALKSSLGIILGGGESGLDAGGDMSKRLLRTALRTIDKLSILIDGLIDVSAIDLNGSASGLESVELGPYLEEASYLFKPSMKRRGIDFEIVLPEDIPRIPADRGKMEQVVQNLLSNSLKSVTGGGRIAVSASVCQQIPVDAFPTLPWEMIAEPKFVDICVEDSGSGFPVDVIRRVNRAKRFTVTDTGPVSGLGLRIAGRLVRQHGGSLAADNVRGGGSVHVYLPADNETGRIIRSIYSIETVLSETIRKGMRPVLYSISKAGHRWDDIYGICELVPWVNPEDHKVGREGLYVWTLGENYALALVLGDRYSSSPMSVFRNSAGAPRGRRINAGDEIRIGWAIGPLDGDSISELIHISLERIAAGSDGAVWKGEMV